MPSKRKSAPHFPLRTSPRLNPPQLPAQDKPLRSMRQRKARFTKTESQSTLTQINYVTTSGSSYELQADDDDDDDEWEEPQRKRQNRVIRSEREERSSKRQSTLTQIDFTKLLTPIDLSENDVEENEEPRRASSMKPKGNIVKKDDCKPGFLKHPSIPVVILKTPKKFRGMQAVPSSQSPPDSPLSIQRKGNSERLPTEDLQAFISPTKTHRQRSPLHERPVNVVMISPNKQIVEEFKEGVAGMRKSCLSQPTFLSSTGETIIVKLSDEEDENDESVEAERCLDVSSETQHMLHSVDAACEKYNTRGGQNVSSTKESKERTFGSDANEEELQTYPTMLRNDTSKILKQIQKSSSATQFVNASMSNDDDTYSATSQLLREMHAYNQHLPSPQDPEPTCIPSTQDCEQEDKVSQPAAIMQPRSTHHTVRSSQATTVGTSPAPTPHKTQHRHYSSPNKHSVVVVPSSPLPQHTSPPMPPPDRDSSPVLSHSTKLIRNLRNQLLEFDYEDDPVSVSQLLPESLVSGSFPMPPPFSSQTQGE